MHALGFGKSLDGLDQVRDEVVTALELHVDLGKGILELVPQYNIESGEDKPVTAARKYIHGIGIQAPALLVVRRNEHTTDRYFWAEKGLFGAQYVEENHFLFPSLKEFQPQVQKMSMKTSIMG